VPLVSLAAWQALVDRAHVKPGQKVLVHGGSGGLGSTVIQLAKHLGATVATTASGKNAELVHSLGADVVDYTKQDFAEVLSGYDVVLDSLGGRKPREVPHGPQARRTGDRRRRPNACNGSDTPSPTAPTQQRHGPLDRLRAEARHQDRREPFGEVVDAVTCRTAEPGR
jgi:threonine dehydrogenase-like Zn-dependent dehydrogenase